VTGAHRPFVHALAISLVALATAGCATPQSAQVPRNVIIMYADGVAATQLEFGRYSSQAIRKQSFAVTDTVLKQGTIGLLSTYPYEAFVTDSAATASAMSTGVKTTIGAVGVGPDGKPVRTAAEAANAQLAMLVSISLSLDKAAAMLGKKPDAAALDKLVAEHFPGFKLDDDLQSAILEQRPLERNFSYPTQNSPGRMVSRQTGVYWGTSGHSTEPVVVGAVGPGAERFKGYMDNTDFGRILQGLLERP